MDDNYSDIDDIRMLPEELWEQAAEIAVQINPENAAVSDSSGGNQHAVRLCLVTGKRWEKWGRRFSVGFMDATILSDMRSKILFHMNAWGQYCNVQFSEISGHPEDATIRITCREKDGFWSYIGTDILSAPKQEATMNLGLGINSSSEQFCRHVRHETGHTLGFPHEHQRSEIINNIDPEKAVEYFKATNGWDAQTTKINVLTLLPDSALTKGAAPDPYSIMAYPLPGVIMKDGNAIPYNKDISPLDGQFAASVYPLPASFSTVSARYSTVLACSDCNNGGGVWAMVNNYLPDRANQSQTPDLTLIKTAQTKSGKVEILATAYNFRSITCQATTCFLPDVPSEVPAPTRSNWAMVERKDNSGPDLVRIVSGNTASGYIEIKIASGKSGYNSVIMATRTPIPRAEGHYLGIVDFLGDGSADLYCITCDYANNEYQNETTRLRVVSEKSGYQQILIDYVVGFHPQSICAGEWQMFDFDGDGMPDLVRVDTPTSLYSTASLRIASSSSKYKNISIFNTPFTPHFNDGWIFSGYNRQKVRDLYHIQTSDTQDGKVSIEVAAGFPL